MLPTHNGTRSRYQRGEVPFTEVAISSTALTGEMQGFCNGILLELAITQTDTIDYCEHEFEDPQEADSQVGEKIMAGMASH